MKFPLVDRQTMLVHTGPLSFDKYVTRHIKGSLWPQQVLALPS